MKDLKICGLQKTTLLDFPGHVAAVVFLGGCNFRCPYCQNSGLLDSSSPALCSAAEVLAFLKKRRGVLDGVCITGGEPTLQPDSLTAFLRALRELGLLIKLDTNGSRPQVVKQLAGLGLIDYLAVDIKAGPDSYGTVCGWKLRCPWKPLADIQETVNWLKHAGIPYEFRTTAVKGLHTEDDFRQIGPWICGCPNYFIQNYAPSGGVLCPDSFESFSKEELLVFADLVRPYVKNVQLRGIDY